MLRPQAADAAEWPGRQLRTRGERRGRVLRGEAGQPPHRLLGRLVSQGVLGDPLCWYKRRECWAIHSVGTGAGNTHFHLDTLEDLGDATHVDVQQTQVDLAVTEYAAFRCTQVITDMLLVEGQRGGSCRGRQATT